jgi:hypothetical protein
MEIQWIEALQPSDVVGVGFDGGLFLHASLHPRGREAALVCAKEAGITGPERDGQTYFPMSWIRAELAAAVKNEPAPATASVLRRVRQVPESVI